jgi:hypothetical protein
MKTLTRTRTIQSFEQITTTRMETATLEACLQSVLEDLHVANWQVIAADELPNVNLDHFPTALIINTDKK